MMMMMMMTRGGMLYVSQTFERIWDDYIWPRIYHSTVQPSKLTSHRKSLLATLPGSPPLLPPSTSDQQTPTLSTFLPVVDDVTDDLFDVNAPASDDQQPQPEDPDEATSLSHLQQITEKDEDEDDHDADVTSPYDDS